MIGKCKSINGMSLEYQFIRFDNTNDFEKIKDIIIACDSRFKPATRIDFHEDDPIPYIRVGNIDKKKDKSNSPSILKFGEYLVYDPIRKVIYDHSFTEEEFKNKFEILK